MTHRYPLLPYLTGLITLLLLLPAGAGQSAGTGGADRAGILDAIAASPFHEPVHLTSAEGEREVRGDIHAILDAPLATLADTLGNVEDWCGILFLHLNVKACVYGDEPDGPGLTLYMGRKSYQDAEVVEQMRLDFYRDQAGEGLVAVRLQADRGPQGIRDVRLDLQAVPLDENRSLLHLHYTVGYGALARMAMGLYFAFGGRDRIGFTIVDRDPEGRPVHVDGIRGMIERNTVRFYFALKAYLREPDHDRLEIRLAHWFDLTERHPEQLREMDRDTYLAQKLREYENQVALQARGEEPAWP
ncbi:SRPBCC family protein [Thioalkalivibrio thiocyanodenitrificans]|uniref:hypothetical protein n=1 Tax=Thioalkalivibrio thiocyanodenitrificans TaxID=243063 RepID=UPI001E4F0E55|nr:hypothetical protein [Thioalkalivibrio thiocyanodenitrificans]